MIAWYQVDDARAPQVTSQGTGYRVSTDETPKPKVVAVGGFGFARAAEAWGEAAWTAKDLR